MTSSNKINKWLFDLEKKVALLVLVLFTMLPIQAQNITPEYQLKIFKILLNDLPYKFTDSLEKLPSKAEFNRKIFLNDTIKNPNSIREKTSLNFEDKVILLTNPNSTFLFQIKSRYLDNYENELVEHYYCKRDRKSYLVIVTKTGVYIRRENSYYTSLFYNEES